MAAPIATHPDGDVVEAMKAAAGSCSNLGWFKSMSHLNNGVRIQQGRRAPRVGADVALLIDVWGSKSLYHSVIDTLFTAAVTLHSHFGRRNPCAHMRCAVFFVSRHGTKEDETPFAMEMYKLLFGGAGVEYASRIQEAVYSTVIVGSVHQAYTPLKWPNVDLKDLRYRSLMRPAWVGVLGALHNQLATNGVVPHGRYHQPPDMGLWIRRGENHAHDRDADLQARPRSLSEEQAAILRQATSPWMRMERLHELPFARQAELLSRTRLLAGMEGAGFVNQLLMPPGGTVVIVSPWAVDRAWQWAYGQYISNRLVYVALRTQPLSVGVAHDLGRVLNAVAAGCEKLPDMSTSVAVHDQVIVRDGEAPAKLALNGTKPRARLKGQCRQSELRR